MNMKFVDLQKEYLFFQDQINAAFDTVKNSGRYLFGEQVEALEFEFAKLIGVKNAVAVGNGTEALYLVISHLHKLAMPILLPNFGAYPTAVACRYVTDNLIYVDVNASMTIDPQKLPKDVKNGILVGVHLFGNNCDMPAIMKYAKVNNHIVVEDCAQSTGSGSGNIGDYSIFSFYPTKPLSAMGDGGMICSNMDLSYFKKARFYGVDDNILGLNSRMDEFQAAIVRAKMPYFQILNDRRIATGNYYKTFVSGIRVNSKSVFHQFTVNFDQRDLIIKKLGRIPYMIHYPKHVNEIPVLKSRNKSIVGCRVSDTIISLPVHPYLTDEEVSEVGDFLYANREAEIQEF